MKHLYVLMSWPEDMDMLWTQFLSFVSVFCSATFRCSMIVHNFTDKHKVVGDINSVNLLVRILNLSHDVASGSNVMPFNKIDRPLVVFRLSGNVMASITMLGTL